MDINWTTVIIQAITSAAAVAIVLGPIVLAAWLKLHAVEKANNGVLAKLITAERGEAAASAVVGEKIAQEVRRDAHSADERAIP